MGVENTKRMFRGIGAGMGPVRATAGEIAAGWDEAFASVAAERDGKGVGTGMRPAPALASAISASWDKAFASVVPERGAAKRQQAI